MRVAIVLACCGLAGCGGCKSCGDASGAADASTDAPQGASSLGVVAEALPRCRADAPRAAIPGDDVVIGDVAIGPAGLLAGLVRTDTSGKRLASIARLSLDLATVRVVDVGPAIGDD